MSKTVLVFSTYFIEPNKLNCLFINTKFSQEPFTNEILCKKFLQSIDNMEIFECLSLEAKTDLGKDLKEYTTNNKKQIEELIEDLNKQNIKKQIVFSEDEFGWIDDVSDAVSCNSELFNKYQGEIKGLIESWEGFKQTIYKLNERYENYTELVKQLSPKVQHYVSGLDFSKKVTEYNEESTEPWLYNRLSYYKLNDSLDNLKVYAVWALEDALNNVADDKLKDNDWIKGLTGQIVEIEPDADRIVLMLHDKDIYSNGTPFRICLKDHYELNKKKIEWVVGVFQHVDELGMQLSKNDTNPKDILNIIEKEQDYNYLNEIVDLIIGYCPSNKNDVYELLKSKTDSLMTERCKLLREYCGNFQGSTNNWTPDDTYNLFVEINQCINELKK